MPNTDLPFLTVGTPANPLPLNDNKAAAINIIVMQPDAWLHYYMGYSPYIGNCYGYVYLDGVMNLRFPSTHDKVNYYNVSFTGYPSTVLRINEYNTSFPSNTAFTSDTVQHKLTIQLYCITFSQIGDYQSNVTQDVLFTIDSSSQTISFHETPVRIDRGTYPLGSPGSSSTPAFTIGIIILVTSVIVIFAVASVLLVYFKGRKSKVA